MEKRGMKKAILWILPCLLLCCAVTVQADLITPTDDKSINERWGNLQLLIETNRDDRNAYLKFEVAGIGTVDSAVLYLTIGSEDGYGPIECFEGASNDWDEDTLTTANAPAKGALVDIFANPCDPGVKCLNDGVVISFDVSSLINGDGIYTLIIDGGANSNDISVWSKEDGEGRGPVLAINEIPEPATMVLLGLGGLLLRKRKA